MDLRIEKGQPKTHTQAHYSTGYKYNDEVLSADGIDIQNLCKLEDHL